MTSATSIDGKVLLPWVMRDVEKLWNREFSDEFGWRVFTLGKSGSAPKAAFRFSMILRDNAKWLDGSKSTNVGLLYETWQVKMLGASAFLEKNGPEDVGNQLGRSWGLRLTFWSFLAPDMRHLHALCSEGMGLSPDAELQSEKSRREEARRLIELFHDDADKFIDRAVYYSASDNKKLRLALHQVRKAMGSQIDQLRFG